MTQIIFYFFGAMLLLSATMVVVIRNPIHAALFLVLSFFSSAAVWLLLNAEFLAIVLVLVYVGAVMVLFLFVVMMLDINLTTLREGFARYFPLGIVIALSMAITMGLVVGSDYFATATYHKGGEELAEHSAAHSRLANPGPLASEVGEGGRAIAALTRDTGMFTAATYPRCCFI